MTTIPDTLRCLFTAPLERQGDTYHIEVPASEVEVETISEDTVYRVAILESENARRTLAPGQLQEQAHSQDLSRERTNGQPANPDQPVAEGDVVDVEIESLGSEGDGLAKIDGFAVFVPSGTPGDTLTVKIVEVNQTVAHARAIRGRQSSE
jgi:predicted RNA-binding protein with TRAM domain